MDRRHIISVPPAGDNGEVVVIEVQSQGPEALDVRLVGCEGENPYVASIKQRNLGKLKHKFKGSDEQWAQILSHFLLQKQPESNANVVRGVHLVYALKPSQLELSFRQDVQGIKVMLGEIVLPKDEEFEFNPFEWAQASAQAHARTLHELAELRARVSTEQDTIAKLIAQLEDFTKTKKDTETVMLQQFMELLNVKKRKIRDQSRLLAGAKVDKAAAYAVQSAREETKSRKPGASRTTKRKASVQAAGQESEADNDQMDVDQVKVEDDYDDTDDDDDDDDDEAGPGAATPDRASDDETEDEEGEAASNAAAKSGSRGRGVSSETTRSRSVLAQPAQEELPSKSEGLPPRRDLPFGRPATRSKPKQPAPAENDDDTEDDEL